MLRKWVIAVVLVAAGLSGCSSKTDSPQVSADPSLGQMAPEAAAEQPEQITIDSPPEEVCAYFIGLLRTGDLQPAERCLTQAALSQIREHELELSAPGSENATYRYQPAEFASVKQEVAFVPCIVVDAGETEEFRMMLRRGERGWKIAGMLLQSDGVSTDLVSFENPSDVVRIKSMLGTDSEPVREAEVRSTIR